MHGPIELICAGRYSRVRGALANPRAAYDADCRDRTELSTRKTLMRADELRTICLHDELEASLNLLKSGFGHLQEIDIGNTFYHLPHQLMASGFERLMKCYVSIVYRCRHRSYPDQTFMKSLGHDLESLLSTIIREYYGGKSRPLVDADYVFISTDHVLKQCIGVLSQFGKKGRYYNLDVVSGQTRTLIDPTNEWNELECAVEDPTPFLTDMEALHRDYFPRVHGQLIARMERLVRAIALQFTFGDHPDPEGELRRASIIYGQFRNLTNGDLGTTDYRRSVEILGQQRANWIRRSDVEIAQSQWPSLLVTKDDFSGDWPFRHDRVTIEFRDSLFCIVYVCGYTFGLNGLAQSRFGVPDPHAAGVAILGKSVGPLIDMTFELR